MRDTTFAVPEPSRATEPPGFTCLRSGSGPIARVTVAGELDVASASQFAHALRLAQADAPLVVLDLRALDFIDGSAATLILAADLRIRDAGGRLVVVPGGAQVRWLFALIGLDRRLELVDAPPSAATVLAASSGARR